MNEPECAHELGDTPLLRWKSRFWHGFAHTWPKAARMWVPDLWIRLPEESVETQWSGPRRAALTFDDGPTEWGTGELLDVLARYNVPATFFLLGQNVRAFPDRARDIQSAGHGVANHFRHHIDSLKSSRREIVREVTEGGRILEDVLGVAPRWCRPPFGLLTHWLIKWSRLHRQQVVLWDVFPPDYMPWSQPASLARTLRARLKNGSIVCLHDNNVSRERTPAMLRQTLPRLIDEGWQFVVLPDPAL